MNLLDTFWRERIKREIERFDRNSEKFLEPHKSIVSDNYGFSSDTTKRRIVADSEGLIRTRDCAIFNHLISRFQPSAVVAAFREGKRIGNINVWDKDHVQINVIDQSIIDVDSFEVFGAADFLKKQ